MRGIRQHHARRALLTSAVLLIGTAFGQGKSGTTLAKYDFEITPTIGINLPYDLWGVEGTLNVYGLQGALPINDVGAISVSALYQTKGSDWGYTLDGGYRHEITSPLFNAFFDVGFHYTQMSLALDRNSDGECVPANCRTDSGSYMGMYAGSGLIVPFSSLTIARLGFRFYSNPQAWVLLSAGLGLRF